MQKLEGLIVETGRVIQKRYLLQRLVRQGQVCTVYQGNDQMLQRAVAVKVVPARHITAYRAELIAAYRAALRLTSQFSHPNIVGIYDVIIEPDILYIVEEFVDGDDFATLLQTPRSPFEIADLGRQICQALIYASTSARKVCHGDLTASSIIRDRRNQVRVTNFALPSDVEYFKAWSVLGGNGSVLAESELPWGQLTEERREEDVRAVGLLLYQLMTARPPSTASVEPPVDGILRFSRHIPRELCEIVARAVMRDHPQHFLNIEVLYAELRPLAEALEPPVVVTPSYMNPAENVGRPQPLPASTTGNLAPVLPARQTTGQTGVGVSAYQPETNVQSPLAQLNPGASMDMPVKLANPHQAVYSQQMLSNTQSKRFSLPILLAIGFLLFAVFFIIGFFLAHFIFFH